MDKRKIDSGRGPENTAEKKKLISPVDMSESDKFILVHTIFTGGLKNVLVIP